MSACPTTGRVPNRGVIEVKGVNRDVQDVARTDQVGRYLERYGQTLVTSYREFLLLEEREG